MKKACFAFLLLFTLSLYAFAQDLATFLGSSQSGRPLIRGASGECFFCGRIPSDYESLFSAIFSSGAGVPSAALNQETGSTAVAKELIALASEESFVRADIQLSSLLMLKTVLSDGTAKVIFNKWMADNKAAIDQLKADLASSSSATMTHIEELFGKTERVTPVSLQQTIRMAILYEVLGSPEATVRVSLCPVCRSVLESLNERLAVRYTIKQ